ncbi:MAG TPA: HD domain-containing protein [Mycobacterium sp.]|uniref:CCA tRNA nucleotidyltransferase n=1 Tax=Mycobacterium sp. TaxID=1785 RepID=UPI002F41C334
MTTDLLPRPTPEVEHVLAVIRAAGGRAMLVGGYVRDALMRIDSKDIDIEVYGIADPDALGAALASTGKVTEAGKSFGVFKVRAGDAEVDVSLPRRESKTGAGHRGFSVIPDGELGFAEASARRDFTVNALMADPGTGEVIDYHGGLADLKAGILRHTSAAFADDPLRVLRGVQFAARFGFYMAPETARLCRTLLGSYAELSIERVWAEWEKIGTLGTRATEALAVLRATCWDTCYPVLADMHRIVQDPEWHPEGNVWTHAGLSADQAARLADEGGLTGTDRLVVVFAALLHDVGKITHTQVGDRITSHGHAEAGVEPATAFLRSVGCPQDTIARILPLICEHMCVVNRPTKPAVRRLVRRLEPATLAEFSLVVGADHKGRGDPGAPNPADQWLEIGRDLTITERPPKGLLTGHHLIAAGMTPGPAFKPILAAALAAQDNEEFDSEEGAVQWLSRNYPS